MPILGTMVDERSKVEAELKALRSELTSLLSSAAQLAQAAIQFETSMGTHQMRLLEALGEVNPMGLTMEAAYDALLSRKQQAIRKIEFWLDTSFDGPTKDQLQKRFFPRTSVFFAGGGVGSLASDLAKEIRHLVNEADDVARRLQYFQAPGAATPALPAPAVAPSKRDSIFVAYSHKDASWLERLKTHLRPLVRDGHLGLWEDTQLKPGSVWREEIETALTRASMAVLLVSADFLASEFISGTELPTILAAQKERGLIVIPVFVAPCVLPDELSRFQGTNTPAKTLEECTKAEADRVFADLVGQLKAGLR